MSPAPTSVTVEVCAAPGTAASAAATHASTTARAIEATRGAVFLILLPSSRSGTRWPRRVDQRGVVCSDTTLGASPPRRISPLVEPYLLQSSQNSSKANFGESPECELRHNGVLRSSV